MLWLLTGKLKVELTIKQDSRHIDENKVEDIKNEEQEISQYQKIFTDGTFYVSTTPGTMTDALGVKFIAVKIIAIDECAFSKVLKEHEHTLIAANKSGTGFVDIRNYGENRAAINKINQMLGFKRLGVVKQAKMLKEVISAINSYLADQLNGNRAADKSVGS